VVWRASLLGRSNSSLPPCDGNVEVEGASRMPAGRGRAQAAMGSARRRRCSWSAMLFTARANPIRLRCWRACPIEWARRSHSVSSVGGDLGGPAMMAEDCVEEASCRRSVSPAGDEDVDDLAVLVNRAVHVTPDAGDLHIRLINEPTVTDVMAARSCRVDQQRREALDPSVDRDVINLDSAFGQ
jgi:hypothetical protein